MTESDDEHRDTAEDNEEGLIRHYFYDIEMSLSTLKRRIKTYNLRRHLPDYDIDDLRAAIQSIVDGPGCLQGHRSIWHTLQLRGMRVPRIAVQEILREIDPEGSEDRKAHRKYINPGPNYAWHCDGNYDKLKPLSDSRFMAVLMVGVARSSTNHFRREVFLFAVRFFILPWGSLFCREILYFAVRLLLLPWHFWATVGSAHRSDFQGVPAWINMSLMSMLLVRVRRYGHATR